MKRESGAWLPWVLLVIALLLLALSETGALRPLEDVLGYVVAPVERGVSSALQAIGGLTQTTRNVQELQQEVETLRQTNEALIQEILRLREYQAENEELRRQLNFAQQNPTYSLVGADVLRRGCEVYPCAVVVGQDINPYLRYLVINAGSRDGIAVGMPVVTGSAVMVGRIVRTSPNLSYVQLINDPESAVSAMLQQSRVRGLVVGTPEGGLLLTDVLPDEVIEEGETVITSALGGLLPRGLILGQIERVEYEESALFQQATVRLAVDLRRLETVLVITDSPRPDLEELAGP